MRFFANFLLLLLASTLIYGQQTASLSGRVMHQGIPESQAVVELENKSDSSLKLRTTADADGNFTFKGVPPGGYRIAARGRENGGRSIDVTATLDVSLRASQNRRVRLDLTAYYERIRETVNVAVDEAQPVEQVSKTVDVIDAQQMRDRADFSLIESLRTIPGFRVQQLGGFGRVASVKSRGLRNQDTAVLIDGIRFRDVAAITGDATPFLSDFTLTSVSRVEVLRGPGSSVYGTNAIGGTIDFQTPEARSGTHGQVGGAFGGLGLKRFRGNVSHGLTSGKFGIGGGISRTVYSDGVDGDDRAGNTNFQSRIDANPFAWTTLSGRFFFSDADVRLNSSPDTAGIPPASNSVIVDAARGVNFTPDINDPDARQDSRFFSGQFSANQILNDDFVISGHYQGLSTERLNTNGVAGIGFQSASTSVFDGSIHTANARLNWTLDRRNTLTAGYEFETERFQNEGRTPSGTGDFFTTARQRSHTFFVQDLVSLADGRLNLAGGVRVQRFSLGRPEFSLANAPYTAVTRDNPPTAYTFDGSASYFFRSTGTKLRGHVGSGYRVPSLYERLGTFFSSFGKPSFIALGDPSLEPEKSVAFDVGLEQNLARERVRLSATYFYTQLTDIIGFGNDVPDIGTTVRPFGGYENQEGGLARGGEFGVTVRPRSSTDIFASYTFTNSRQRTPQVDGSRLLRTLGVPDHQFTFVATQRFKRFWVNFDFLATSTYLAPIFDTNALTFQTYVYRFDGNRRGDLTGGYTFPIGRDGLSLRVFGTVENVFNQEYFENGFRTAKANARIGASFAF